MKKLYLILVAILLASLIAAGTALAEDDGAEFEADLTGAAEVPGPGDPDGSGEAEITLDPTMGKVCWKLEVEDIAPASAAHIHVGPAGVAGPIVVPLSAPTMGESSGCRTVAPDLIAAIMANPAVYYVNVHNAEFPAGALRGQLQADD